MSSFNSPSQSSEIDCAAPESIHNDPPGRSGLRLPQEGQDNVIKPILWILVLILNCLDIVWLDIQHQAQQVSAVLRSQQFFKYPRRITFRQRIVNGRGCVRIIIVAYSASPMQVTFQASFLLKVQKMLQGKENAVTKNQVKRNCLVTIQHQKSLLL